MKARSFLAPVAATFLLASFSGAAVADEKCALTINSNDAMQFSRDSIVVDKSCKKFTLTLTHSGKLAENVMGHNWVLTESGDVEAVAKDGMSASLKENYVKPDDKRVIAHTEVIGGGEKTSVTFKLDKLDPAKSYTYFCSFPGHYAVMRGTFAVK